jgi:hypothetical protein
MRMGGLFQAPKPTVIEPTAAEPAATAAKTEAVAEEAGRDARAKALERARRGLAGTIATSARGVLDPLPAFATRKSLLGE